LLVRKAAIHGGALPNRWGMVEISPANVVLTAFKPTPGGATVLRVYEAAGQPAAGVTVKFHGRIASAYEANLLEDSARRLKVQNDSLKFDLHPFEIKTISFQTKGDR